MKLRIDRKRFSDAVTAVLPAVAKGAGTIIDGILVEADDAGRLTLSATNYDLEIRTWTEADAEEPGAVVFPGALLGRALSVLAGDIVQISLTASGHGRIECGETVFEIAGHPATEFPERHVLDDMRGRIEMQRDTLIQGLAMTLPFVLTDDSRPALSAVRLALDGRGFAFAATDGHRLGTFEGLAAVQLGRAEWRIHRGHAAAILAALQRTDESPWLAADGRNLTVVVGNTTLRGRLGEEMFPNYTRVIPDIRPEQEVVVDRARLHDALRRVAILSERDKEGLTTIVLTIGGDAGVELSASKVDAGKSRDAFGLFSTRTDKKTVRTGVNPTLLGEALTAFKAAKNLTFQVDDQYSPMRLTSPEIPGAIHVLMPVRL